MLSTVPSTCRSALENEFRTGEMLFRGRAPPCGVAIDSADENGGPIGVIAELKPARARRGHTIDASGPIL